MTPNPIRVQRVNQVRNWIFVYFWLLILEGVLRKWAVSNFLVSAGLLLVRDPVVMLIYVLAWRARVFPRGRGMRVLGVLTAGLFLLGLIQVFFNDWLKLTVVVYGLRCYCLHLPLVFLMARVFRLEDVRRVGRWLLLIAGPMALLMVAQFVLPPDSFLNRATLGEGSTQIGAALGRIRPAGTFSYGTGATSFNLLMAAFLIYSLVERDWVSAPVRWTAGIAYVLVLPISGSRTFVLSTGLLLGFAVVAGKNNRRLRGVTVRMLAAGGAMFALLALTPIFREGILTFATRWEQALGPSGSVEDAIGARFLGEFINAFYALGTTPLQGYGLGLGSNVGAALTSWSVGFFLAETEWERTVMEMGPILAIAWLTARTWFGAGLYRRCLVSVRRGRPLPWLLLGTECFSVFNGMLQQPTSLGFLVLTTGLCLAAIKAAAPAKPRPAAARPANTSGAAAHLQLV